MRPVASASLIFGVVALLLSSAFLVGSGGGWAFLIAPATLSAFLVALPFWWACSRSAGSPRVWHGALAGAAVGLLSHPLMWFLTLLLAHLLGWRDSLNEPTLTPTESLGAAPVLTVFSWLFLGWLTAPVGAVTGALMAFLQRRSRRPSPKAASIAA